MTPIFYIVAAALVLDPLRLPEGVGDIEPVAQTQASNTQILSAYLDAYNRHDIEALLPYISDNFRWYSVDGETLTAETIGRAALKEGLEGYFRAIPTARSEFGEIIVNGDYLSVKETAYWMSDGTEKSQSALAVYYFVGGKIETVWYFPAQR